MYYYFKQQDVTYKVDVLIVDVYSHVNFESLQICPHFTDFEFTNWTRNREVLSLIPTCFFFVHWNLQHLLSFTCSHSKLYFFIWWVVCHPQFLIGCQLFPAFFNTSTLIDYTVIQMLDITVIQICKCGLTRVATIEFLTMPQYKCLDTSATIRYTIQYIVAYNC